MAAVQELIPARSSSSQDLNPIAPNTNPTRTFQRRKTAALGLVMMEPTLAQGFSGQED